MVKELKVGLIGFSEGNGHPYSFSAIINGYDPTEMKNSGWEIIYNYLENCDRTEFCNFSAKVTHVWTQDRTETEKIAKACYITFLCDNFELMIGEIDALILARDDYENHYDIAIHFLRAGIPVFIDKPLSLNIEHLLSFKPYLESGQLMSCSGYRYARELDGFHQLLANCEIKLVVANVIMTWEKYGVHMLEAIYSILPFQVDSVTANITEKVATYLLSNNDGSCIVINILGNAKKTFNIDFWTQTEHYSAKICDNFSAFRRTLAHFFNMIESQKPVIDSSITLNIMRTLMAGQQSALKGRKVLISEIKL